MLELIRETWREVGIKLLTKPSQREVFRTGESGTDAV